MIEQSAYEIFNDKVGIKLSYLLSDIDKCTDNSLAVLSYSAYEKRARRQPGFKLKDGRGPGNEVLIAVDGLPQDWYKMAIERFGQLKQQTHPLGKFFNMDGDARTFFDNYQFPDNGEFLTPVQKRKYTVNASVMLALVELKSYREMAHKSRGSRVKGLWISLAKDCASFNEYLKTKYNCKHSLPAGDRAIKERYAKFIKNKFDSIIDGRNNNTNAQLVTPEMINLWKDIYAGQRPYKATYIEVSIKYNQFLAGQLDVVVNETGEIYNCKAEYYRAASESTIYQYQSIWENKIVTHSLRSGDRQVFKGISEPFHKLRVPEFAGSIISIDDRQPPFEYAPSKRMWFYCGADLGSEVITTYVYGESKEGIMAEFYRQMVRNYAEWGLSLPYELECESSLNSSYTDTLLQDGAMFSKVRIEANNARGKKIEQYWRQIRYGKEFDKKHHAWIARPFSLSENNQKPNDKVPMISKSEIVQHSKETIALWNAQLHSNQVLHPGLTREDVFLDKQHQDLKPINWAGILPYIGHSQKSSMKAGRIILQGRHRVVGFNNEVATGEKLISIMKRIEGQTINLYWLDDNEGEVLKALVFDLNGTQVCELLGDLEYSRATLEMTEQDKVNRSLTSAYAATVQSFIKNNANAINRVTLIEEVKPERKNRLQFKDTDQYKPADLKPQLLQPIEDDFNEDLKPVKNTLNRFDTSTKSRF